MLNPYVFVTGLKGEMGDKGESGPVGFSGMKGERGFKGLLRSLVYCYWRQCMQIFKGRLK